MSSKRTEPIPAADFGISAGDWEVAAGLTAALAQYNDRVVINRQGHAVADCRNTALPAAEQRCNAHAIAALPRLLVALVMAEEFIGDLPNTEEGGRVHDALIGALRRAVPRRALRRPSDDRGEPRVSEDP